MEHLSPLPPDMPVTSQIQFARECMAVDWLVDAYNQLARRKESVTEEEITMIGLEAAMQILRVREQWLVSKERISSSINYYISDRTGYDYRSNIRSIFNSELNKLDDGSLEPKTRSSGEQTLSPRPYVEPWNSEDTRKKEDEKIEAAKMAANTCDDRLSSLTRTTGKKKGGKKMKK
jgi:hypothetical protein